MVIVNPWISVGFTLPICTKAEKNAFIWLLIVIRTANVDAFQELTPDHGHGCRRDC